ncbi:Hap43p-repressed protein [Candida albicans P78042]|nr:Hap43p-repressed protein [Candida albicans P78042]
MGLEVSSFHFVCSSLIIIDNCSSSSSLVLNLKLSPTYHKLEIRHFLPYGTPPPSPPPLLLPLSLLNIGGANESFSFTLVIVLD